MTSLLLTKRIAHAVPYNTPHTIHDFFLPLFHHPIPLTPSISHVSRAGRQPQAERKDRVEDALFVCQGADEGAKDHARREASKEEDGDLVLREAIRRVQAVKVRALEPVGGWGGDRGARSAV